MGERRASVLTGDGNEQANEDEEEEVDVKERNMSISLNQPPHTKTPRKVSVEIEICLNACISRKLANWIKMSSDGRPLTLQIPNFIQPLSPAFMLRADEDGCWGALMPGLRCWR